MIHEERTDREHRGRTWGLGIEDVEIVPFPECRRRTVDKGFRSFDGHNGLDGGSSRA